MKLYYILLLTTFITVVSCKKEKKVLPVTQSEPTPVTETVKTVSKAEVQYAKLDEAFIQASQKQKANLMITDSIWHVYFALSIASEAPKENIYKGHWLDLKPDGSYTKGVFDQTTDQGKFVYSENTKNIELRSSSDSSSEWTVKVDPQAMLFIGTNKYNNYPWQIKFLRKSDFPAK